MPDSAGIGPVASGEHLRFPSTSDTPSTPRGSTESDPLHEPKRPGERIREPISLSAHSHVPTDE
jgi:hypothetical protein